MLFLEWYSELINKLGRKVRVEVGILIPMFCVLLWEGQEDQFKNIPDVVIHSKTRQEKVFLFHLFIFSVLSQRVILHLCLFTLKYGLELTCNQQQATSIK